LRFFRITAPGGEEPKFTKEERRGTKKKNDGFFEMQCSLSERGDPGKKRKEAGLH